MPVASGDIDFRLSGGAANSDPNASIGGAKSSTELVDNSLHNLFDAVSGAEHTAGDTEYRCLYVHNSHGSISLTNAVVWIQSDSSGADSDISIGVGAAAVNATETAVANESTAPASVTFSDAATSRATGLSLGTLPAGQHRAIWIRRTVSAGTTPQASDTASIQAGGDTL
jgi:hypothetical protein